ncbi:MAG: phosphoribosylamine--glycine ligase [Bacilli bacterium]|nr:phosphoribosylamine--glycine ligase [Bacilli bacterium]
MNVLIIGSGGREHALAQVISKSNSLTNLYAIPGNIGIAKYAKCIEINPLDNNAMKDFVIEFNISLVIPGSEVYLENGITDALFETSAFVFGPTKEASQIETSKEFAKNIMKKYDIPTAEYEVFSEYNDAKEYVLSKGVPIVLKYDGLAAGKGVVVAYTMFEALEALKTMLVDKKYGSNKVVIEEFLQGEEFSLISFVFNDVFIPMPIAQDHKRLLDNDLGPNTGGMGIYSPVPIIDNDTILEAENFIVKRMVKALLAENIPFVGFLYAGLILTANGPKVIEFNARLGDPEAEVILPKLQTDFLDLINGLQTENVLYPIWKKQFNLGVVLASKGYPNHYDVSVPIYGVESLGDSVYHMGTSIVNNHLVTNGGRVLLVCGEGKTLEEAKQKAYNYIEKIRCDNLCYRSDIGNKSIRGMNNG